MFDLEMSLDINLSNFYILHRRSEKFNRLIQQKFIASVLYVKAYSMWQRKWFGLKLFKLILYSLYSGRETDNKPTNK